MTSLQTSIKQVGAATAYYIPLADIRASILAYNGATFSPATWANAPLTGASSFSSLVQSAGAGLLKDMGKTVVSSTRTFRKIQLVVPNAGANSTFGVAGGITETGAQYLTGYIEMGFEGSAPATKVAKYGA